jgi:hypothetical protein
MGNTGQVSNGGQSHPDKKSVGAVNKAAFVRELPATMTAKQAIAHAAKQGIKLTESYVYNVRGTAKKARLKASGAHFTVPKHVTHLLIEGQGGGGGGKAPGPLSPEELLMAVASEVGLSRAILILTSARLVVASALTSHSEPSK